MIIKNKDRSSLKNVKALQQIIGGNHKTQTRKHISLGDTEKKTYNDGEEYTDSEGITWIQKKGYRINKTKLLDLASKVNNELNSIPDCCPSCNEPMKKNVYNIKMYKIHTRCIECVSKMEYELMLEGKFNEYQNSLIKKNIDAWLVDAKNDMEQLRSILISEQQIVGENGKVETWSTPFSKDPERLEQLMNEEFENLKTALYKSIGYEQ